MKSTVGAALLMCAIIMASASVDACSDCGRYGLTTWDGCACYYPGNFACPAPYNAAASSPCGGTAWDGTQLPGCPAYACATSTAVAISGPTGCAKAISVAKAASFSKSLFVPVIKQAIGNPLAPLAEVCDSTATGYVDPGSPAGVALLHTSISKIAPAVAEATAKVLGQTFQIACSCCTTNNFFSSGVNVSAAGVAQAIAYASVDGLFKGFTCNGIPFITYADASAVAADIQAVLVNYFNVLASTSPTDRGNCATPVRWTSGCKTVTARAVACAMASIWSHAVVAACPVDPGFVCPPSSNYTSIVDQTACSASMAFAGSDANPLLGALFQCGYKYFTEIKPCPISCYNC